MSRKMDELGEQQVEPTRAPHTLIGLSTDTNTERAARSVLDQVNARTAALTLVFYSPEHDADVVARVLEEYAGESGLAGSTAGELAEPGFLHGSMVAFSVSREVGRAAIRAVGNIDAASLVPLRTLAGDLAERLDLEVDDLDPERHIWLGLFDGLAGREEMVVPFFARHASEIPLVGGSLGDEERMEDITLVHAGQVHRQAIAIVLLEYNGHFATLQQTHHRLTSVSFMVTGVSKGGRIVTSLDDRPAAEAYAEALGVEVHDLDERLTGSHPLGQRFRGRPFPCSVMRANDDGSMLLAYGVQVGERLTLLEPTDLVESTAKALEAAVDDFKHEAGHGPESILTFHCLGRYREANRLGVVGPLFDALNVAPIVGLNTYGEQYGAMHMNHSVTAIMFG